MTEPDFQASYILLHAECDSLRQDLAQAKRECDEMEEMLGRNGEIAHSCGPDCQRDSCRLRRENESLRKEVEELRVLKGKLFAEGSAAIIEKNSLREQINAILDSNKLAILKMVEKDRLLDLALRAIRSRKDEVMTLEQMEFVMEYEKSLKLPSVSAKL